MVLTLDEAVARAMAGHPSLAAARREVAAAEGALEQARAWRNPSLSTTLEDTRRATRTTTATVDIPIELGGKRPARQALAERALRQADAAAWQAQAQLRAQVVSAFYRLAVAQERARLSQEALQLARRGLAAVTRRVAAGKVSPVEQSRARVDEANAQLEAEEAAAGLGTARFALATELGDSTPLFTAVDADAVAFPERPPFAALAPHIGGSPSLRVRQAELQHRQAGVDAARSAAVPDVTLSLGARRDSEAEGTQAVIGLSVPLPLFDQNRGAITEATRQAEKAALEMEATRLALLAELQEASARLQAAAASMRLLQEVVVPAAREAHAAASTGFEAGKFGFLDVLDAQRSLLQARARHLDTLAAAWQAAAVIDRIVAP